MSSSLSSRVTSSDTTNGGNHGLDLGLSQKSSTRKNYSGFLAGIFSGMAKLSGMFSDALSKLPVLISN